MSWQGHHLQVLDELEHGKLPKIPQWRLRALDWCNSRQKVKRCGLEFLVAGTVEPLADLAVA